MFDTVYDFSKFLSFRLKDDFGSGIRLLSTENLYFTSILAASLSFVLLCIVMFGGVIPSNVSWLVPLGFWAGLGHWLIGTAAILFIFLLRFLFILGFGALFNLPVHITRHFQETQSLNNCFVLLLMITCFVIVYSGFYFPQGTIQVLAISLIFYLTFRLLNIYIKLSRLRTYSLLYIFSYLCTTEIIPALVGIQILF